jgi:hypothetical protein
MHWYLVPHTTNLKPYCVQRFPGHLLHQIILDSDSNVGVGWGIELLQGIEWQGAWVVGLAIFVFSLAFGVTWTIVKEDVSGGFTVAGWLVGSLVCLFGSIQVGFEMV